MRISLFCIPATGSRRSTAEIQLAVAFAVGLLASPAWAQGDSPEPVAAAPQPIPVEPDDDGHPPWLPSLDFQMGLAVLQGPAFSGAADTTQQLKPVWSLRFGRVRFTSSRAALIERDANRTVVPGASLDLGSYNRWQFDAALRLDTGRDSGDSPRLTGFADVPTTLRGRLTASYRLNNEVRADLSTSTDLLQRGGGTLLGLDLSRRDRFAPGWRWSVGAGMAAADATYHRSYHGVSAAASRASGLPRYTPGAGWHQLSASTGLSWQVLPHWRIGTSVAWTRLLGPAADSPLTEQRNGWTFTAGLAYIHQP